MGACIRGVLGTNENGRTDGEEMGGEVGGVVWIAFLVYR